MVGMGNHLEPTLTTLVVVVALVRPDKMAELLVTAATVGLDWHRLFQAVVFITLAAVAVEHLIVLV
jgi:hypothetical protein